MENGKNSQQANATQSATGRGGARPGAGKPKGYVHQSTLEREAVLERFRQRAMANADALYNAQYSLAVGSQMVFRRDTVEDENGKKKTIHTLVTDPIEVKEMLDATAAEGGKVGEDYYIITTIQPDNRALDSIFDRTFGRPTQVIELPAPDPNIFDAAQRLVIFLTSVPEVAHVARDEAKLQEVIQMTARMKKLPVEPLEREVRGLLLRATSETDNDE